MDLDCRFLEFWDVGHQRRGNMQLTQRRPGT